jgi:hypothetical protein
MKPGWLRISNRPTPIFHIQLRWPIMHGPELPSGQADCDTEVAHVWLATGSPHLLEELAIRASGANEQESDARGPTPALTFDPRGLLCLRSSDGGLRANGSSLADGCYERTGDQWSPPPAGLAELPAAPHPWVDAEPSPGFEHPTAREMEAAEKTIEPDVVACLDGGADHFVRLRYTILQDGQTDEIKFLQSHPPLTPSAEACIESAIRGLRHAGHGMEWVRRIVTFPSRRAGR